MNINIDTVTPSKLVEVNAEKIQSSLNNILNSNIPRPISSMFNNNFQSAPVAN